MDEYEDSLPDKGYLLRLLRRATEFLERHVIPVFRIDERENPDIVGTGILAMLNNKHYLITAAHVLDVCDTGVFLLQSGYEGKPLSNNAIVSSKKFGESRLDDQVDIGFVRLTEDEMLKLGKDNFLDLNHVSGPSMKIGETLFIALGYPIRDQVRDHKNHMIETPITMFTTGPAKAEAYKFIGVDEKSHIVLKYNRRHIKTRKSVGSPPDFRGMSGGGVWPISVLHEPEKENPPLFAGIVIERPDKYSSCLLVTRGIVIRYFVNKFDHT